MSLPSGIANRPPLVAPHPVVVWRIARLAFWVLLVGSPLLIQVATQIGGVRCRYESNELRNELRQLSLQRRQLLADRSELLSPARLEAQARRLGLRPAAPGRDLVTLDRGEGSERRER